MESSFEVSTRCLKADPELGGCSFEALALCEQGRQTCFCRSQTIDFLQLLTVQCDVMIRVADQNQIGQPISNAVIFGNVCVDDKAGERAQSIGAGDRYWMNPIQGTHLRSRYSLMKSQAVDLFGRVLISAALKLQPGEQIF